MEVFNPQEKILQYIKSKDKAARIIGLYLKAKGIVPENQEQLQRIYKRFIRAAKELDCYSDEKIIAAMKYLIDNADYKWTIETVLKFVDEDFVALTGKKPIIILKNGERVYSVERIKALEREGKIYYTTKGWKQNFSGTG